jgi:BirA family transcriptional regulator, biotin operon repressor / biotin---[acetyl-CoA-carboxylase] ligase
MSSGGRAGRLQPRLGLPRVHLRRTGSTNDRARELAVAGAPHGTLVTADEQTAGRGRQGRSWTAPAGSALLASLVLHDPPALLPLAAAVAVAQAVEPAVGRAAAIKWPNDVLVDGRKVAGILAEGRPQESWAVLGIGVNVAVETADLPPELRATAGTLGLARPAIEDLLIALLAMLERWLAAEPAATLEAWRTRDALAGHEVAWAAGSGTAVGIDAAGRLVVELRTGGRTALDAGEIHLTPPAAPDCT